MTPQIETTPRALRPLESLHIVGLWALLALVIAFGVATEIKGAFQKSRKTDAGVYFRAAWAVRAGEDPYKVTDQNDWRYHYPPTFAILSIPFADPVPEADRTGYLPYAVSLALWYIVSAAAAFLGAHILASALEKTSLNPEIKSQRRYCQRWWSIRIWPVIFAIPVLGRALVRGQVSPFQVLMFAGVCAAILRGIPWRAGFWLAMAICMKIIPVYLISMALWRRNFRFVAWTVLWCFVGLFLLPLAVMGVEKTKAAYHVVWYDVLLAGAKGDTQGDRAKELTSIVATSNASPMAVIHNIIYRDIPERAARPEQADPGVRMAHWIFGLVISFATAIAAGWRRDNGWLFFRPWGEQAHPADTRQEITRRFRDCVFFAALTLCMIVISPVSHMHYPAIAIVPIMLLMWAQWERRGFEKLSPWTLGTFIFFFISHVVTILGDEVGWLTWTRDFGVVLASTLALWFACVLELWHTRAAESPTPAFTPDSASTSNPSITNH
jgi:alpha-1,2-mannosyltransferase